MKLRIKNKNIKDNIDYWLFLILPMLCFFLFFILPNIKSIYMSFFEWDGMAPEKTFVGIDNFIRLFTVDQKFLTALRNTLVYTIVVLIVQNVIALFVAVLISDSTKKRNSVCRTIIYLPYMLSSVAVGFIWTFIYDPNLGLINEFLEMIGRGDWTRAWLNQGPKTIIYIALVHVWFGIGQGMILFIAGLQQVPKELYEAASVDGAGKVRAFFKITLPVLKPTILTVSTLTILGCFKSFDFVYLLTGGGADNSSTVLALQIYKEAFQFSRVGYSSAISVVLLVVVSVIAAIQFRLFKEKEE